MNTVCKSLLVVIGLILGGCASTPKPVMSEETLKGSAANWVSIEKCGSQGSMSPELAAEGKRILVNRINQYSYNTVRLNGYIQELSTGNYPISNEQCNKVAMNIVTIKQSIIANQQASSYNQQQEQAFINSTRTKNTYCNTIGTQTLCNTY